MYRSARFLPIIEANLDVLLQTPAGRSAGLSGPPTFDVEVLVSDRHGLDDAFGRLQARYGADPRVRFFASKDELDWVGHYNWLLARATGEYFAWMPHDDTFPNGYYTGLVEHLDAHPDTLLAFGPMIAVDSEGRELPRKAKAKEPPPWHTDDGWSNVRAYRVLQFNPWVPFRGVFRRQPIVDRRLTLPLVAGNQGSDVAWIFGVALCGALRFVPVPACIKRFYADSTHKTTMPFTLWSHTSNFLALGKSAWWHSPSRRHAVRGLAWLVVGYLRFLLYFASSPAVRWKPAARAAPTRA